MRYALLNAKGDFIGKYHNIKDALTEGRKISIFRIWDTLEDRLLLTMD